MAYRLLLLSLLLLFWASSCFSRGEENYWIWLVTFVRSCQNLILVGFIHTTFAIISNLPKSYIGNGKLQVVDIGKATPGKSGKSFDSTVWLSNLDIWVRTDKPYGKILDWTKQVCLD